MLKEELLARKRKLEELDYELTQAINQAPEGSLRIAGRNGKCQYYHRKTESDKTGTYIPQSDTEIINELAQKDYDNRLLARITKDIKAINDFYNNYGWNEADTMYDKLNGYRQKLVKPRLVSDDEFTRLWESADYAKKSFREEDSTQYYTRKGERVRSKSEILIADILNEYGVPYRYECPLHLDGGKVWFPDFTLLNINTRTEAYLEHFGMLDDPDYRSDFFRKISIYNANGIIPGVNLYMSFESSLNPLNSNEIRRMILNIARQLGY